MIGALLRIPAEAVRSRILAGLAAAGFGDVRRAHLAVLQYPSPHGLRPIELSAHVQLSKQALNPLINDLERAGYLRREPDPRDSRARILALTPRRRELVATIRRLVEELEDEWAKELGEPRFRELKATLRDLGDIATRSPGNGR